MKAGLVRVMGYALVLGALLAIPIFSQMTAPGSLKLLIASDMTPSLGTSEYSLIERLQVGILFLIVALGLLSARWQGEHPALSVLLIAIALVAIVRENDLLLDYFLIDHAWQVIAGLMVAVTVGYQYQHWKSLRLGWLRSQPSPGIALMLGAAAMLLIVAGLVGHEPFWQSVMAENYQRSVKIAVEELVELSGYWLWLVGQSEFAWQCRAQYLLRNAGERHQKIRRRR